MQRFTTQESIAGTSTTSTVSCSATAYLLPADVHAGEDWRALCWLGTPRERVVLEGRALGPGVVAVGASRVEVEHVRVTLSYDGTQHGTNPTDFWVVPRDGLIARERESVTIDAGGVRYREGMVSELDALRPER